MNFEEFWMRLLAGVTFSQPIKSNVARKWRVPTLALFGVILTMTFLHYWAQDIFGPLGLLPLAFCLVLCLFDPTTRLITTVFYISLLSLVGAIFFIIYLLIATQGHIIAAGGPLTFILIFNCIDGCLALLTILLSVRILSDHDLPEAAVQAVTSTPPSSSDETTQLYNESQPLWRSFEGSPYKVEDVLPH